MKHFLRFGAALAFLSSTIVAACTMDFDQFQPTGGGGSGGAGGSCGAECCKDLDCPAPTSVCREAACINGACTQVAVQDGTPLATQTVGDCKSQVCQGGAVATVNDDTDTGDINGDCTEDLCSGGTPASTPESAGVACTSGVCDGLGACVECLMDADCPAEESCDTASHQCVPATCTDLEKNGNETDVDCGGGTCPPCAVGDDCETGTDCTSGVCAPSDTCAAPSCNDGVQNGSETDVDCGGSCFNECGPGEGCNEDEDCDGNECSGVGGTCVPNCDDDVKNNNETDVDCGGGTCNPCGIGDDCTVNEDCSSGNCGPNGTCGPKPTGATCQFDGQCQTNQCEDGYCCATNCFGNCRSCGLAGSEGTCSFVPSGQDPNNDCPGPQVCDGTGGCKKLAGQTCNGSNECLGSLVCVDGVCCNEACGGTCRACNVAGSVGTCTFVPANTDPANECTGATNCDGAGMCTTLDDGQACFSGAVCKSGICVDGVCCNEACGGTCRACDIAGSEGTCINVPDGQDPDNECPGAATCNGAGACP